MAKGLASRPKPVRDRNEVGARKHGQAKGLRIFAVGFAKLRRTATLPPCSEPRVGLQPKRAWLPSQKAPSLECLHPHQATVLASAISTFSGANSEP